MGLSAALSIAAFDLLQNTVEKTHIAMVTSHIQLRMIDFANELGPMNDLFLHYGYFEFPERTPNIIILAKSRSVDRCMWLTSIGTSRKHR